MASGPITSRQIVGETMERVTEFIFLGSKITADGDWSHEKTLSPWKRSYYEPRQHIKKQRHYFANKGPSSQSYGFSSSHVWMSELDYKESWAPKNWFFWTVVLEKNSWESLGLSASPLGWRSPRSVLCGGSFNISCSVQEFSLCSPDSLSTYGHSIGGHRMAAGCIPQTFFPYGTLSPLPPVLLGFRA